MREIKLVESIELNEAWSNEFNLYKFLPEWFYEKYYPNYKTYLSQMKGDFEDFINGNLDTGEKIKWENVQQLDWKELLDNVKTVNEYNAILELYFLSWCKKNGIDPKVYGNSREMIIKILSELGIDEKNNPFFNFFKNYEGNSLNNDQLTTVNNAYAGNIIDFQDVNGTGHAKTDHIIFNPTLYEYPGEEQDELVNIYEKLSDENYMKNFNVRNVWRDYGNPANKNEPGKYYFEQWEKLKNMTSRKDIRNLIMFQDGDPKKQVLSLDDIMKAINSGEGRNYNKAENDTKSGNLSSKQKAREMGDLVNYLKRNIESGDFAKVVNQLIRDGYLNINDIRQ